VADAGNYLLASNTATTTADITPATISAVTGITAASRVYDATTNATLNYGGAVGFTGIYGGDVLTVATASGAFADKHAGTGKTVNISGITLGGADAGNYNLATPHGNDERQHQQGDDQRRYRHYRRQQGSMTATPALR
jgi:hypothetical protein